MSFHVDAAMMVHPTGADRDVAIANELGLPVYHDLTDIPGIADRPGIARN